MSDGNSMNELKSFGGYESLLKYINKTKPIAERYSKNGRSPNAGKIPLGERRYVDMYWCRKVDGAVELFCESRNPVVIWYKNNKIKITSDLFHYYRSSEFLTRVIGTWFGMKFYISHRKMYLENGDGNSYFIPQGMDYDIISSPIDDYLKPAKPVQEYKHVMRKKDMAEIRARFKPFYQYMQAVLAVDPEFGLSYEGVKYYDMEEFENFLRNPTDDPSIMKQVLVKCTSETYMRQICMEWSMYYSNKSTRIGFKQAKEQFELMLKVFYFNEVFEFTPVEIGKEVHDLNDKYRRSKRSKVC